MKDYVCLGTCQALISEQEYRNGLTACGNENCNLKGHTFVEGDKCQICRKNFSKAKKHPH